MFCETMRGGRKKERKKEGRKEEEKRGKELLIGGPPNGDGGIEKLCGNDLKITVIAKIRKTDKDIWTRGEDKDLPFLSKGIRLWLLVPDEFSLSVAVCGFCRPCRDAIHQTVLIHVIPEREMIEPLVLHLGDDKGTGRVLTREGIVVSKQRDLSVALARNEETVPDGHNAVRSKDLARHLCCYDVDGKEEERDCW